MNDRQMILSNYILLENRNIIYYSYCNLTKKNYFSDYYLNSNVPFGTYFSIETSQQSKSIYFDRFEYSIKDFLSDSSKILHVKLGAFLNNFCMNCAVH